MFNFVKKLMFARLLKMEEGKIVVLNQDMLMEPAILILELMRRLQEVKDSQEVMEIIYESSKRCGKEYMQEIKKYFAKSLDKLLEIGMGSLNLAGWGKIIVEGFDWEKRDGGIVRIENSTMADLWKKKYGISKIPVDYIMCGFVTGGLCVICDREFEGKEIRCSAMGAKTCEIMIKPVKSD